MAYRTDTLCGIFHTQALRIGDNRAFLTARFTADGSASPEYHTLTWKQARDMVLDVARGLMSLGVQHSDRVVLISENRPQWIIADQAIQACRAIGAPISPTVNREELAYMLEDSVPRAIMVSQIDMAHTVRALCLASEYLQTVPVIVIEPYDGEDILPLAALKSQGRARVPLDAVEDSIQRVIPSDIASIIYTSGTTGQPKGVVLTQANWVANLHQCTDSDLMHRLKARDFGLKTLVHLPLCHVYGRMCDYHMIGLHFGGELVFAPGYESLSKELLEIRPHVIFSIPRFYEKTAEGIRYAFSHGRKQTLFHWALARGWAYTEAMAIGTRLSPLSFARYVLAHLLVFNRIKRLTGLDRLIFAVSGGGKLDKEVCTFLRSLGLELNEGYGMTETGTVITFNIPEVIAGKPRSALGRQFYERIMDMAADLMLIGQGRGKSPYAHPVRILKMALIYYTFLYDMRIKPGSVGRPLADTEQKIDESGEILIKGPQVFAGYWRMPEDTEEIFTTDGWLKTGDIGHLDREGFLEITDRKREIFVTSSGKNIAPFPIESALTARPYIEQACLIAEGRKYLTALIVPDIAFFKQYARTQGIAYSSPEELLDRPEIQQLIQEQVEGVNQNLARFEQIKSFTILKKPFAVDTGELTPSLKLKRAVIYERYRAEIEGMYTRWGAV